MRTSSEGLALIKSFEGLRLTAYRCPAGVWTIGYGTTSAAGVGKIEAGMKITQVQAESMLIRSLVDYEEGVLRALVIRPTQNQFDALVSLAYNIGIGAMSKSSVVKALNRGDVAKAGDSFMLWNKAGGKVLPGLVRRREAEKTLFLRSSGSAKSPAVVKASLTPEVSSPEPSSEAVPRRSLWQIIMALFKR